MIKSTIAYCFLTFAVLVGIVAPSGTQASRSQPVAPSAVGAQEIVGFDQRIPTLMSRWQLPGGAVAVVKDGRLVFAKGYGVADRATQQPVHADSLFRIASISKPITSAAVLRLIEEGKLSLDDRAFRLLDHLQPPPGTIVDSRIDNITIRQLLEHTGGWDLLASFDPMFISDVAAQAVGAPAPASADTIIRYMLAQPLQFAPGTAFSYSNFGYNVLGRVIEKVSGQSYESYVREALFNPAGVTCMRVGRSLPKDRAAKEVRYYDAQGAPPIASVFPDLPGTVPAPDGGWHHEALDSTGGWIASAIDVARFVSAIDGFDTHSDLLRAPTIETMISRPNPPLSGAEQTYYAMGWGVVVLNAGLDWQHTGALNGTSSYVIRNARNGVVVAAVFNSWGRLQHEALLSELGTALYDSINEVQQWPAHDLSANFVGCEELRADFNLALTPSAKLLAPGEAADIIVDAVGFHQFQQAVKLSAKISPPASLEGDHLALSFSSLSLQPGDKQTLTVRALPDAAVGEYRITLTGMAEERSHTAQIKIVVAFGPQIQTATFDGKKNLRIEGLQFGNHARVLINGTDRSAWIVSQSQTEIRVKGKAKKLGLRSGENLLQVVDDAGKISNVASLRL